MRPGNQKILLDEAQELMETEQNVSSAWTHQTILPRGSLAKRNRKAYRKSLNIFYYSIYFKTNI